MDSHSKSPSLFERSNWMQRSLSSWIWPFYNGRTKFKLEERTTLKDLPRCPSIDDAELLFHQFNSNYHCENDVKKDLPQKNQFMKTLCRTFIREAMVPFGLFFVQDCLIKSIQPILIGRIIRNFAEPNQSIGYGLCLILALCSISLLLILTHHPSMLASLRISMRVKIVWNVLIHQKCLRLSSKSSYNQNISVILNLLTNQTRRFDEFFLLCNHLLLVPIQTVVMLAIAYHYIGPSCLITFIIFLLFAYINSFFSKRISILRHRSMCYTDQRLRLLDDCFRNLVAIKIYLLEETFLKKIFKSRRLEIEKIAQPMMARSIMLSISTMSSRVIMYLTFVISILMFASDEQKRFSIETLLVSITLFEKLRFSLVWTFPQAISATNDMILACLKMEQFLDEPDHFEPNNHNDSDNIKKPIVKVNGLSLKQKNSILKNLHFQLTSGQCLMINGSTGSGKSSLLLSLLGEIPVIKPGQLQINGTVAYSGQEAYCFNTTVRENILFGLCFKPNLYRKVLKLTRLDYDLERMPNGDQTFVGQGGCNLSGGQKSRISLARALYSEADVYLLDNPFSALDNNLSQHIWKNCIQGYLRNKIVLLTTVLTRSIDRNSENVMVLKLDHHDGHIYQSGENLESKCVSIRADKSEKMANFRTIGSKIKRDHNQETLSQNIANDATGTNVFVDNWQYLLHGSNGFGTILWVVLTSVVAQMVLYLCDYWLSQWQNFSHHLVKNFLTIYTILIMVAVIFALLRSYTFYRLCNRASEVFHNKIIVKIIHAPIGLNHCWLGINLLNYFSRDIGTLDETLPATLFELSLAMFQVFALMVVMILFMNQFLAIITFVYMFVLYKLLQHYIRPIRLIRKFELNTRNAMFTHLSSTLNGLSTIRVYHRRVKHSFEQRFHALINDHTAAIFFQNASSRFFCLLVDLFSLTYIACILILFQIFSQQINHSLMAISLASMFNLIGVAQWACKRAIDSDLWINSFRNLSIFNQLRREENNGLDDDNNADNDGPIDLIVTDPVIETQNLNVFYDSLFQSDLYSNPKSYILKNINVRIERGQKIGICGRSGSGKSTFINALLRLANFDGELRIGGNDSQRIPLRQLRRRILTIPQNPIILDGSVRENLELYGRRHTDKELWEIVEQVNLGKLIKSFKLKLDQPLNSADSIMSTGQKQLFCLARMMLADIRKLSLVLLDEATAHVDQSIDKSIQKVLRKCFNDCTMIIIAHRIDTIMDCDRILVFDDGHLVEDDDPGRLLSKSDSYFYRLVINNYPDNL